MGLFEKLKSLFGSDSGQSPTGSTDPNVTVEREPSAESEHAVKGTDESAEFETEPETEETADEDETAASEAADEDEPGEEGTAEPAEESPSVEEINGIGPTYADRLAAAGIETVADLGDADPETVADAAETSDSRAASWIEQAEEF